MKLIKHIDVILMTCILVLDTNDFCHSKGSLYVDGSENIISDINQFLKRI